MKMRAARSGRRWGRRGRTASGSVWGCLCQARAFGVNYGVGVELLTADISVH